MALWTVFTSFLLGDWLSLLQYTHLAFSSYRVDVRPRKVCHVSDSYKHLSYSAVSGCGKRSIQARLYEFVGFYVRSNFSVFEVRAGETVSFRVYSATGYRFKW